MNPVSLKQSHQLISVIANNTDWGKVSLETAQYFIDHPKEAGEVFTKFLESPDAVRMSGQTLLRTFRFTVNYDLSVEDMVKLGKYDWANSDITSNHFAFIPCGKVRVEAELLHLNRYFASSGDVLGELEKLGYRPAYLADLLAFGAAYPEEQRKYPIAALGSVWRVPLGRRSVAYLGGGAEGRCLYLLWFEGVWRGYWRFLAVRK